MKLTPPPRIFCSLASQQLFRASWNDFETRFGHILESLENLKKLVERKATQHEIRAAQTHRAAAKAQFDELMKQEDKRRRIAVAAWLNGAKSHLDQHEAKATREAYPRSGRWLLDRPKMKAWLDVCSGDKPLLWLRAIPGAGEISHIPSPCSFLISMAIVAKL
jgi:hypothetical protein